MRLYISTDSKSCSFTVTITAVLLVPTAWSPIFGLCKASELVATHTQKRDVPDCRGKIHLPGVQDSWKSEPKATTIRNSCEKMHRPRWSMVRQGDSETEKVWLPWQDWPHQDSGNKFALCLRISVKATPPPLWEISKNRPGLASPNLWKKVCHGFHQRAQIGPI